MASQFMKLAKAPQEEIDRLMSWLQAREGAGAEAPPPFMRVVFGYETLVQNCCDSDKDYLEFKPCHSPADVTKLRGALNVADVALLRSMQLHACDPCHITEAREAIAAALA